jgi:hypothetical protein
MTHAPEAVREHAYLVARGVRPLALVGNCASQPAALSRAQRALDDFGCPGALAFVLDRGDGFADYGYAAASWALDLYTWAIRSTEADNAMTVSQRHRIIGLLLGYSISAISDFETADPTSISLSAG